ncbi:MAG: fused response regulator/phosphatase [Candidatus Eremiobacterota bacterium]
MAEGFDLERARGLMEAQGASREVLQVLLVEDNEYDVRLIRRMLDGQGHFEVACVDSLAGAVAELNEWRYDVVLLDLGLRDSSGLDSLERLHSKHSGVPIVVLTGTSPEKELGLRAVQLGAEDYLVKGHIGPTALARALRYVVERHRRHQLQHTLHSLQQKLAVAREIQSQLLACPLQDSRVDLWGAVFPATTLSGDFHDVIRLPDGRLALALGDVTGHGFGSALLMATARAYLRATLNGGLTSLADAFAHVNALLASDVGAERFVCLSVAILDPEQRWLSFASAGQPPAYLLSQEGHVRELFTPGNLPLGVEPSARFGILERVDLAPGDLLALTTDGALEATDPGGNPFDADSFLRVLEAHRHRPARDVVDQLHSAVEAFCGPLSRRDDLSLIVARIL